MSDRLYALLPAIYRLRDAAQAGTGEPGPLQALLGALEGQLDVLRDDIGRLYDNWFIETCDEWVVPYIGDLLGMRPQYSLSAESMSLRPFVANTLGYRRSKGTAAMLEGLVRDVTGWSARAVEMFRLLAATEHVNHVRAAPRTPDLRDGDALERLGGPFESALHTVDVRRIATGGGRYNIGNVGLFVWRLESIAVENAPAIPAIADGPGRYRFGQLGADLRLFNPQRDLRQGRLTEADAPGPLRARALFDELRAARAAVAAGESPSYRYFAEGRPALRVFTLGAGWHVEIPPSQIQICDLGDWDELPTPEEVQPPGEDEPLATLVSVDPVRGRLAILGGPTPSAVRVSYYQGAAARIGGGCYHRALPKPHGADHPIQVADATAPIDDALSTQLAAWAAAGRPSATFTIGDSGIYAAGELSVPAGATVVLRAAAGVRPLLRLLTPWRITLAPQSTLVLSGLWITGAINVTTTAADDPAASIDRTLRLDHCTLVPGLRLDTDGDPLAAAAAVLATDAASRGRLNVTVHHSIVGRLDLSAGQADFATTLTACDSVIDGCGDPAPAVTGTRASRSVFQRATVLGKVVTGSIEASDSIFDEPISAVRTQIGCVRFSFVPAGSKAPSRFRCQPALALETADPADAAHLVERLRPSYTSRRFGDPGYAQLAGDCPAEISGGAEANLEMGAHHLLRAPARLANLRAGLDEYLRFGLEAGIFLVT